MTGGEVVAAPIPSTEDPRIISKIEPAVNSGLVLGSLALLCILSRPELDCCRRCCGWRTDDSGGGTSISVDRVGCPSCPVSEVSLVTSWLGVSWVGVVRRAARGVLSSGVPGV